MAALAQSALWDSSATDPCVPPEEIHPPPQPQVQPAAAGPAPQANPAAAASSVPAAGASASAAAVVALQSAVPHVDRSVPGSPLTCTSPTYATGGDAAAQEYFLCPKSGKPLYDPVQCANGHYTCRGCLTQLNFVCPICSDASNVQADVGVGVKGILNGLRVLCADCGEEVTRDRLTHHRNNLCQLPCIRGCGATATRTGAEAHEAVCPFLPVTCAVEAFGCAWKGARRNEAAHTAACSLHPVLPALRMMSRRIAQLETEVAAEKAARVADVAAFNALRRQVDEHVQPLEWHMVVQDDAWCKRHGVVLSGEWKQENDTIYPFGIAKDAHGRVQLEGVITGGQVGVPILTLPVGYRPATSVDQSGNGAGGVGEFTIDQAGTLVIRTKAGPEAWFSFDGCSFSTV